MKPAPLLATLLGLAGLAGLGLYLKRSASPATPAGAPPTEAELVARELGIPPFPPAPLQATSPGELHTRIATNLKARFGAAGLEQRSRAFAFLSLLPSGQDLESLLVTMEATGTRGWFDDHTGTCLVATDFAPDSRPDDHATLIRLRTHEALYRQGFRLPPGAPDDQWITHRILHGALALALQQVADAGRHLPSSEETEREATLLSLPVFLLNLAQSPEFVGLPYLRERRESGTDDWLDLLRTAPTQSSGLLGVTTEPAPPLPAAGSTLLEESLGAYATQLLLERHSDYERAEELILQWRSDRYRLFSNGRGEHLVWHCRWATPEAATAAADLLRNTLTVDATLPGNTRRVVHIETRDGLLRMINCADPATLAGLLEETE